MTGSVASKIDTADSALPSELCFFATSTDILLETGALLTSTVEESPILFFEEQVSEKISFITRATSVTSAV
jgi:hypothetical protein|uniref:Uncharacterized protein n=1 Tax=Populus trichocarpa TaxID=3694 RepID=A0A2K1YMI5_POPTR